MELPGAESVSGAEGNIRCTNKGEVQRDLARSYDETPSMRGSAMRENRETLHPPAVMVPRAAVGSLRTHATDVRSRESDCPIVPTKFPNKERRSRSKDPWQT